MDLAEELRFEISRSINTLRRRQANTADTKEGKAIQVAIDALNDKLDSLDQADLLAAAIILADAADDLEKAVAAARRGPFDGYLSALEGHLDSFYRLSGEMHARDALPTAESDADAAAFDEPAAAPRSKARSARGMASTAGLPNGLQAPQAVKDFALLKDEYQAWYDACKVRPGQEGVVAFYVRKLKQGQANYALVEQQLGIPWAFIGIIHGMECGFNFATHMHNGDPLKARTTHVPAGRPTIGQPPFTWRQSAVDALTMKGYHQVTDWSVARMLWLLERYNGMGYRMRSVATPYLWSFSNLYAKGKYVQDGRYDPEAVSKQCGAALMLKAVR